MTPTETADILRQLHDWLRGGTQWAPTMGAEAVETAIEALGRLEAAERERDNAKKLADVLAVALNTSNHERANLRAKIEQMTKRLRTILEEPKENMSNSKALREMVRQARLALEESK